MDFDGTIWDGGIMPGAKEKLAELRGSYHIGIYSARKSYAEIRQMGTILVQEAIPYDEILPPKPDAVAYIDDKGVRFTSWATVSW